MPRVPLLLLLLGLALAPLARAGELDPSRYDKVDIPPVRTSIYIGRVTLTLAGLVRHHETYTSAYSAKVFPYFFYNEQGHLSITVTDEMLQRLAKGETVQFQGSGLSSDGEERHIEGKAVPVDALSGHIKVRVFVSKHIQLIFNTTYRFHP